jgi:2-C-methyl-D-erythritol 4-phosphate cytidylyltransferase / 2-C-methyl-D-erythritol 2,4-cyclodiphosphate synthase
MDVAKKTVALIVAAGSGSRVGGNIPKQFLSIAGKPMLRHSYEAFSNHKRIDNVIVVIGTEQEDYASSALLGFQSPILVMGGLTRQESVLNGLQAIANDGGAEHVLIHDAARPFLSAYMIDQLIEALCTHQGAVPTLPVVDSLAYGDSTMTKTVERSGLWRIQTPQAFHFETILKAHMHWDKKNEAADDARMAMTLGVDVALIPGDERLAKYTFASDFEDESSMIMRMPIIRTGTGYDVHRLIAGEELWLCGIKLDYPLGLSGHSDADVALHAITDAVLGALALGDIGDHFPPSDQKWRGVSSDQFLKYAMQMALEKGFVLGNIDVTIICEAPKVGPYRLAMRSRLVQMLEAEIDQISVKATTTERLGFTGRSEGIAAQAIATLIKQA